MQQLPPVRIQFGLRGWAAIILGLAIIGAVAFLAIGLLIFLLPVMLLSTLLYWFLPKPKRHPVFPVAPPRDSAVIDGNFQVIERDPGANP